MKVRWLGRGHRQAGASLPPEGTAQGGGGSQVKGGEAIGEADAEGALEV